MTLSELLSVLDDKITVQIVTVDNDSKKEKEVDIQKKIVISNAFEILKDDIMNRVVSKVLVNKLPTSATLKITI